MGALCKWHAIISRCHVDGCARPPQASLQTLHCDGHAQPCLVVGCRRKRKRFVLCRKHAEEEPYAGEKTKKIRGSDLDAARTLIALAVSES